MIPTDRDYPNVNDLSGPADCDLETCHAGDEPEEVEFEDDGQPSEYQEWQDFMGGDDWDHGQYDSFDE